MNENKICFISCVNDHQLYKESLYYINQLEIPEGYEIECIRVEDATSMTQGYNKAMKESDAKYKVYLHQDVYIINKSFIRDVLDVFNSNDEIGMLGMAGAKTIPTNGVWWESAHKYGEVYESHTGKMELLQFNKVTNNYEEVKVIDGLIMITQYDIPWREDIFDGWHFYDVSQSVEFTSKGYRVVIPEQDEIWCIHDCGILNVKNGYEHYRDVFLEEYSRKIFPLVSILIPAYNQTKYLREALESAINQTYRNIEIVIGDDSSTNEVERFIAPYLEIYNNITYFKNDRMEIDYGYINHVNCLKKSKGEYINFLNHDDIFHISKIEKMMNYFLENPNITLVTSVRQTIDENGNHIVLNGPFTRLFDKDTLINGHEISRYMITSLMNCIGEPTTVLFKKFYINEKQLNYFNGVRFKSIGDVANWFTLLQYGDIAYISEPLSYFRIHSKQNSEKPEVHIQGAIAWYELIKQSYESGIIKSFEEYKIIINKWLTTFILVLNRFIKEDDYVNLDLKNQLENTYNHAIKELLYKKVEYNFYCPICDKKVEKFLPYQYKKHKLDFTNKYQIIGSDTENFTCPNCHCHDRMRHIVMYFNKKNIWKSNISNKKVIHIAPEIHLSQAISRLNPKEYVCADLYPTNNYIKKIDITDIPYKSNHFDFVICNHVLEHILDDLKAMKEMYRVLKKVNSIEDKNINTDELRKKFYGQSDHVRIYGLDFFERLKRVGFSLEIMKNGEFFTQEQCKEFGVNYKEDLILVKK